jgi:hypothetical protein
MKAQVLNSTKWQNKRTPCQKCKSKNGLSLLRHPGAGWSVSCKCGNDGPVRETGTQAIIAWDLANVTAIING